MEINSRRLPTLSLYHIGLNGDQLNLFPAWVRSDKFISREEVVCYFTSPDIQRQITAFGIGLSSMCPADRPQSLEFNGDLDLSQALLLLDMAGRARVQSVELEVFHLDWSSPQTVPCRIIHKLAQLETLKIDWPTLSSDHWRILLQAIAAPKLKALTLSGGGVPWNALASFLARHPAISELNLPASDITRLPLKHCALKMPYLHRVEGKLAKVISFVKILTHSAITSIHGEIPRNTSLFKTIDKMIASLAACRSDISLFANLTSTQPNGPLTRTRSVSAKTWERWRRFSDRLAHLRRLRLTVAGMQDSTLLVSCLAGVCDTF